MINRKKFLRLTSISVGGLAIPAFLKGQEWTSLSNEDLANAALAAARAKEVTYADVRIARSLKQATAYEVGIRALVKGSWGFAATSTMTEEAIVKCTEEAVANAIKKSAAHAQERYQYDLRSRHEVWRCIFVK
jgi:TldD protein